MPSAVLLSLRGQISKLDKDLRKLGLPRSLEQYDCELIVQEAYEYMVKRCCNALELDQTILSDDLYDNLHIHESNTRARVEEILLGFVEGMQQELLDNKLLTIVLTAGYGTISINREFAMISPTPSRI